MQRLNEMGHDEDQETPDDVPGNFAAKRILQEQEE